MKNAAMETEIPVGRLAGQRQEPGASRQTVRNSTVRTIEKIVNLKLKGGQGLVAKGFNLSI